MKPFAVIFDMDGVLVDSNPYHKKAWQRFFQNHGFDLSESDLKTKVYGKINSEIITHFFGKLSREQIKKYACEKESLYRKLIEPEISSPEGLLRFLSTLKEKKIDVAIATSAPPENVMFVLKKLKIIDYFNVVVDESQVKRGKPDPEIYLKTAEKIGRKADECLVIEDSLSGVRAAKAAGMKVIAITTTHFGEELMEADFVIKNLNEITYDVLERLTINNIC